MSCEINEIKEVNEKSKEICGNKNNSKIIKMTIYGDDKEKNIHKKGVINKTISKKGINSKNMTLFSTKIYHSSEEVGDNGDEKHAICDKSNDLKIEKVTVLKKDPDNGIFKVPHLVPKKNHTTNGNHMSMRKRIDSISNSSTLASRKICGSSQEILKQIAAKAAKARLQRIRNNSSISERDPIIQKNEEIAGKLFDEFLPYSSSESSNDEDEIESKSMEHENF